MNNNITNNAKIENKRKKAKKDGGDFELYEILYEYHQNPSYIIPRIKTVGIEIETVKNESSDILFLNALDIVNCADYNILDRGYSNSPNALWDATQDCTVDVEFVSRPLGVEDAKEAIKLLYSYVDITGGKEVGNHFHINLEWINDLKVFTLLSLYLAPKFKKASRRNDYAWSKWSYARHTEYNDFEEVLMFYKHEYYHEEYPLTRESDNHNTVEFRGFTSSENVEIALKQLEAVVTLTEMSNSISTELNSIGIRIDDEYNSNCNFNIIKESFDEHIYENDYYELLKEISKN